MKFSMMPLWMTVSSPVQSTCGWALRSFGRPWVAQRVCGQPGVRGGVPPASDARRSATLPARLRM